MSWRPQDVGKLIQNYLEYYYTPLTNVLATAARWETDSKPFRILFETSYNVLEAAGRW